MNKKQFTSEKEIKKLVDDANNKFYCKHFHPNGCCYRWMKPLFNLQKKDEYPPLMCEKCGNTIENLANKIVYEDYDINEIPF